MKRILSTLIALAVVIAAVPAFAGSPVEKMKSGAKDVITSPMEIYDNVVNVPLEQAANNLANLYASYRPDLFLGVSDDEIISFTGELARSIRTGA